MKRQYEQTKNPLYVWEAISCCLRADEQRSLPDWCLAYLRDTAANLYGLACGVDFREPGKNINISSDQALKLTARALSISKQGKRNAFASLRFDCTDMRHALTAHYYGPDAGVSDIERSRSTTREAARRRIARGSLLLGFKRKTSP
jgi:hypothetical protein